MHGMCHQRSNADLTEKALGLAASVLPSGATGAPRAATPPVTAQRPPTERVTNAEREATATLLRKAFGDGVIHIDEFDQRLSDAYAAKVAGDLQRLTDDLPQDWLADLHAAEAAQRRAETHRRIWRGGLRTYLNVMALLVTIWGLTSLAAGELLYPWPIWPALGWGIPTYLSRPRGPIADVIGGRRVARAR